VLTRGLKEAIAALKRCEGPSLELKRYLPVDDEADRSAGMKMQTGRLPGLQGDPVCFDSIDRPPDCYRGEMLPLDAQTLVLLVHAMQRAQGRQVAAQVTA